MFDNVILLIPGASTSQIDPATSILVSDTFGETEIKELVNLGFTREQVGIFVMLYNIINKHYLKLIPEKLLLY